MGRSGKRSCDEERSGEGRSGEGRCDEGRCDEGRSDEGRLHEEGSSEGRTEGTLGVEGGTGS